MKYLVFGYYDKDKFDSLPESERNAMFDACFEYDDLLRANGHWVAGEALQGPETAVTLRWESGKMVTTDGPYTETKEQLGGLLVIEARDLNHAIHLVSQHPGLKSGSTEIRAVGDMSEIKNESERRRKS